MRWSVKSGALVAVVLLTGAAIRVHAVAQEQPTPPAEQPSTASEQAQPPAAPAPQPSIPVTLGEFAIKVAERLKMQAPGGAFTPESAAWALLQGGIKLRGELGSNLTEADAVSTLSDLGFNVRSKTPSRLVTRDRLEVILTTFVKPVS